MGTKKKLQQEQQQYSRFAVDAGPGDWTIQFLYKGGLTSCGCCSAEYNPNRPVDGDKTVIFRLDNGWINAALTNDAFLRAITTVITALSGLRVRQAGGMPDLSTLVVSREAAACHTI